MESLAPCTQCDDPPCDDPPRDDVRSPLAEPPCESAPESAAWSNPRVRRAAAMLLVVGVLWPVAASLGGAPEAWRTVQVGMLIGLLAEAVYTDFAEGLIRNTLTAPATLLAGALAVTTDVVRLGEWWAGTPDAIGSARLWSEWLSPVGVGGAALGALGAVAAPLFMFLFGSGGGGDVKLAFVVGLLLGWPSALVAIAVTYLAAAFGGAIWVVLSGKLWKMLAVGFRALASRTFPAYVVEPTETDKSVLRTAVPMAPFFAIGVLAALVERGLAA